MKIQAIIPTAPEVMREAIIVMAGALLAVVVVRMLPVTLRQWFDISQIGKAE